MRFSQFITLCAAAICGTTASHHESKRAPCIVPASGYESIDDSPAINEAIRSCGNGGTIILSEAYSIRSPIDFTPCQHCDVQLEGLLFMSDDWNFWINKKAFLIIEGVTGLRLRSLTGKGVIDGHGRGFYQRYRNPDPYNSQPILAPIIRSTDIEIENITVKNAPKEFFRVDGESSHIRFASLTLLVQDQWQQEIWTRDESIAFQVRNSTNIEFDSITVQFRSTNTSAYVGTCISIDYGTSDVVARGVTCDNTYWGITVQHGGFDTRQCQLPLPPKEMQWAKNILVTNYTANSLVNSGFMPYIDVASSPQVTNLTYDGVNVIGGETHRSNFYARPTCPYPPAPHPVTLKYMDIWFKNYRGNLGAPPPACRYHDCLDCRGECSFHFEGWPRHT